ncbi:MAG TPA: pyridoxal-phosphate dependent enzyme, partial [Candidatus Acidoferrales bacterium]|nr:pyridoxal-phosphate dependent enzyme [Candidatus Acidoferrales bacterium]
MNSAKKPILADASATPETIGRNVLDCIGNTPLLRLERLGPKFPNVEFYGKAEWFNPGGSVKDRPALEMIREAERSGKLKPGQTILDATSGNTG